MQDAKLVCEFVEEAQEHLGGIEMKLLQVEALGADINDDLVSSVFRAIHSIKGAAGFLSLVEINKVAHRLENVLGKVREHQLIPDAYNVDVMLKAADRLRKLIESVDSSNETDNSEICDSLDTLLTQLSAPAPCKAGAENARVARVESAVEADLPDAGDGC
ncbi:Hpt domain-containing protein [Rubripirellula sp.]|nr:Hpt domain-containing protein [Rubripirellula sp.]MDF1844074.1 Hpt domain-containing protein [Rubripirellula sp.]